MNTQSIDDLAEQFHNDCLEYIKDVTFESLNPEISNTAARNVWTFRKLAELQIEINQLKNK